MSLDPLDDSGGGTAVGGGDDTSAGGGTGTLVPPQTGRGRDWAALRQFSVFLENRVGHLADLTRTVEDAGLRIAALSIQEANDFAVARLIVDDYEKASDLFELSDFDAFESDVLGVELPDSDTPLTDACRSLLRAEIGIHYAYSLTLPGSDRGGVVLHVDDVDEALTVLAKGRASVVTEQELKDRFA